MEAASKILSALRGKGIQLWSDKGQLRYRAPEGSMSQEDIHSLRQHRTELLSLLELEPSTFPLSYSQRSHWNSFGLRDCPAVRQIASATRFRGELDVKALESAISELVRRHPSLRTRIVTIDGEPRQKIDPSVPYTLKLEDLTKLHPDLRDAEIRKKIAALILEPIDPAQDPLFEANLLHVGSDEHILIVAMEHIISDAHSMGIFLRELHSAYAETARGHPIEMLPLKTRFADYALRQQREAPTWLKQHDSYWKEHIAATNFARFPSDTESPDAAVGVGWDLIKLRLDRKLKDGLVMWCRKNRTTPALAILAAFCCVLWRWCGGSQVAIQYQTDGRTSELSQGVIGFFACPLYLLLKMSEQDTIATVLQRLTTELYEAYDRADFCFLENLTPRPPFMRSCAFNWLPLSDRSEEISIPTPEGTLESEPFPFEDPILDRVVRDSDPVLLLLERHDCIEGRMHFLPSRHSAASLTRFTNDFVSFIEAMLNDADIGVDFISSRPVKAPVA